MDAVRDETKNDGGNSKGRKFLRVVGMVFVGVVFAVMFALVFGLLVKWLWNWLMPAVFGFRAITYWQAFAMVVLAKLLFGAFGAHHQDRWSGHSGRLRDWHHRPFHNGVSLRDRHGEWKYYPEFWQEEGKAAFEAYRRRMERDKDEKAEEEIKTA
jgi:hypothetical protein